MPQDAFDAAEKSSGSYRTARAARSADPFDAAASRSDPAAGLPGIPKPKVPNELLPESEQEQSFWTSPHGLIRSGLRRAVHGVEAGSQPGIQPKIGAASEVIRGLGEAAIPAAIPLMIANPVSAIGAAAVGTGSAMLAGGAAKALGATPEEQALSQDVAGILAGGGGAKAGITPEARRAVLTSIVSAAGKIDRLSPETKLLGEFAPLIGKGIRLAEVINRRGTAALNKLNNLPKETRAELAHNLYKEVHGDLPKTAVERVQAVKELNQALKLASATSKAAPKVKAPPLQGSSLARRRAAESASATESASSAEEAAVTKSAIPAAVQPTPNPTGSSTTYDRNESLGAGSTSARELRPGTDFYHTAKIKNKALAARFKSLGMTPEQVSKMTEVEYDQHRIAINAERKSQGLSQFQKARPGDARRYYEETRGDIAREMSSAGAPEAPAASPTPSSSSPSSPSSPAAGKLLSSIKSGAGLLHSGGAAEATAGNPQTIAAIRSAHPEIPKAVFDKAILDLADNQQVYLTTVDSPVGRDLSKLVKDPQTGKYYTAVTLR